MPEATRRLRLDGEEDGLTVTERAIPSVGVTDVLVEIEATGVGLTVANKIESLTGTRDYLPRIPGHELVGKVVDAGDGVTHVEPGDLVTTHFYLFYGHCSACISEREPLCMNSGGQLGVEADGGYAEYATVPGRNAIPLPDGIDLVDATVLPDAVAAPYHVCRRRAEIVPDDRVLVLGAGGGAGVHTVQMTIYFGAEVTAVDQHDEKLATCDDLGRGRG